MQMIIDMRAQEIYVYVRYGSVHEDLPAECLEGSSPQYNDRSIERLNQGI